MSIAILWISEMDFIMLQNRQARIFRPDYYPRPALLRLHFCPTFYPLSHPHPRRPAFYKMPFSTHVDTGSKDGPYVRAVCTGIVHIGLKFPLVFCPVCHISEPCKNGWTDWDIIWVKELGGPKGLVLDSPWERPMINYRWAVQKRLNQFWDAVWDLDLDGPKEASVRGMNSISVHPRNAV